MTRLHSLVFRLQSRRFKAAILLAGFFGTAGNAYPKDVLFSTVDKLKLHLLYFAQCGDRLLLANGVHKPSAPIVVKNSCAATSPLVIAAQSVGGVMLKEQGFFRFRGARNIMIRGFHFAHLGGERVHNPYPRLPTFHGMLVPHDSSNIRFTLNTFQLSAPPSFEEHHWLTINAHDVVIDYNEFIGKRTKGNYVAIGKAGSDVAKRTWVHHNHFYNHYYSGTGGEVIQLGHQGTAGYSAGSRFERNLIELANGDNEAISSKSDDNVIRYNTIRNSKGSITLRSADRNQVYGNYIDSWGGGIRIHGDGHRVFNNMIVNTKGEAIIIASGEVDHHPVGDGNLYEPATDAVIAFNTLVNNEHNIETLYYGTRPPRNVLIANNIILGPDLPMKIDSSSWPTGFGYDNNIVWGSTQPPEGVPPVGYLTVDPRLVPDFLGVYRLTLGSPAIDVATARHPEITMDYDGQTRWDPKDIGADERRSTTITNRPLTPADVGPTSVAPF
jgi:parallel beta-helix repeat protein